MKRFVSLALVSMLAACGGGGDPAPAAPAPQSKTFNLSNIEGAVGTFTVSGVHEGVFYERTVSYTASTPHPTIQGARTYTSTVLFKRNGVVSNGYSDIVFQETGLKSLLSVTSKINGAYTRYIPRPTPPGLGMVDIGASGDLNEYNWYRNVDDPESLGPGKSIWSLEAWGDDGLYCVNYYPNGVYSDSNCKVIDKTGHFLGKLVYKFASTPGQPQVVILK